MILYIMSRNESQTRTNILKAALHLLEEKPAEAVRMADIAKMAKVSRQAVYLHFPARAELLIAVTHFVDDIKQSDARLEASRQAQTGKARLSAFVSAWGEYIPEIYGVARALLAMYDSDEAARGAWDKRMQDMREGCEAAINALHADGQLAKEFSPCEATDFLWSMLSVRNWEHLTQTCGWSQEKYLTSMEVATRKLFVAD